MGTLFTLVPLILRLLNNPTVVALMPLLEKLLAQLGTTAFPGVDPAQAGQAAAALFDTEHVKWVQAALTALGYPTAVDGVLGEGAKDAVRAFQTKHGLDVDGWPGALTADALRAELLKKLSA